MKKTVQYFLSIFTLSLAILLAGCATKQPVTQTTTTSAPTTSATATTTTTAPTTSPVSTAIAYTNITAKEGLELIQKNSGNTNFVVLDVRTPDEFNSGHIKDALNIDVNAVSFEQEVNKLDKNKTYLVYCRSGRRSVDASEKMLALGFKYIYNMTGGILEWQAEGYPVVQ